MDADPGIQLIVETARSGSYQAIFEAIDKKIPVKSVRSFFEFFCSFYINFFTFF
jgi:hypothetical protein